MTTALDFSFARPSIADIEAAGIRLVIRYLTGPGKAIDKAELDSYLAAGISVAFVFEVGVNDMAGGFAQGVINAHLAISAAEALGVWPIPIYFTVDEDLPDATVAVPYFQGIDSVAHGLVGDYGEGLLLLLLNKMGLTQYHWLSESTGFPDYAAAMASGIVGLQQLFNASPVDGTDLNNVLKVDVGQYPRPTPKPDPPPPAEELDMARHEYDTHGNLHVLGVSPNAGHVGDVVDYIYAGGTGKPSCHNVTAEASFVGGAANPGLGLTKIIDCWLGPDKVLYVVGYDGFGLPIRYGQVPAGLLGPTSPSFWVCENLFADGGAQPFGGFNG